jgi:hypothetical protein
MKWWIAAVLSTVVAVAVVGDTNLGLVGVAEIAPDALDQNGETLGGCFSGMCWDPVRQALVALTDRGPLDGAMEYQPRVQVFDFAIDLAGTNLHNITLRLRATILLRDESGTPFSGADANDPAATNLPRTVTGRRAIDPEAIVRAPDGTFYIGDEYGPFVYQFDADFKWLATIVPPAWYWPRSAAGLVSFRSTSKPASGRTANHGFEGLGLSPDGHTLLAMLQTPLAQDKGSRTTRLLTWTLAGGPPKLTGEYLYPLESSGQSEIVALSGSRLLVLERDNRGLGHGDEKGFCRIYVASLKNATNILPFAGKLAADAQPATKTLLVDMMNPAELARAGIRRMPEKWEGMCWLPESHLLLVGVDNDFKARHAIIKTGAHPDGERVAVVTTQEEEVPTLLFAYRVDLE